MGLIQADVVDRRLLGNLQQMLRAGVVEATDDHQSVCHPNEEGTPQGGVISPLLANIFLNELDHQINRDDVIMIRYADDFVICCRTETKARAVLDQVRQWTSKRRLTLHPEKTTVVDMSHKGNAFEFLGWRIKRWEHRKTGKPRFLRTIREKSVVKFRERLRPLTKRTNGFCLPAILGKINPIIRGFGAYFKSAEESDLVRLDKWIRMRLRSILRKRHNRKGRGRGHDHNRWPNSFFARLGLITLMSVRAEWSQSLNG
jgi:RNA-directed DNA polymerase